MNGAGAGEWGGVRRWAHAPPSFFPPHKDTPRRQQMTVRSLSQDHAPAGGMQQRSAAFTFSVRVIGSSSDVHAEEN